MVAIIVQKNGTFVSSTGIVPITLGSTRNVALPSSVGSYTIEVRGKDGCLDQVRTTSVAVKRQALKLPGLGG